MTATEPAAAAEETEPGHRTQGVGPASAPGPERALRADARRNYQRLVSAAAEAFTEHGADDVSLEEIARRAGVGIGTLYRHFPTRAALLEAVYTDQVAGLRALADDLLATKPPAEALATWLRALIDFGRTKRSLSAALLATMSRDSELISSCSATMLSAMTDVLTRAQQDGTAHADASPRDLLRMGHAISMTTDWAADPAQADRLLALLINGLRTS
jgi:AcrR family transcriptional regulator